MNKLTYCARNLRKNMTKQEQILWSVIRNKKFYNYKFLRQYIIGEYIADFVCREEKIIIEIDGGQHNEIKEIEYDKERTSFLKSLGYKVIRFWNNDIDNNLEGVYQKLQEIFGIKTAPTLTLPHKGGHAILNDKNLYYIGGVVRDEILGLESLDVDLTYNGDAIEFAKNIPNAEIIQINEPFGTVRIKLDNQEIDIASTRSEIYPRKGHLPVVNKIGCPLKEDILRRDFTINAMAKSTLTEEIIDYIGGLEDIKNKKLRVLHDNSFIDDPTRILRALKFAVRFGFKLDKHTKNLQDDYLANINYDMSYKRLKKELVETFNLNSVKAFRLFIEQNIYKLIAPQEFELPQNIIIPNLVKKYKPKHVWIIYVGLLPNISALPLTKTESKIVEEFHNLKTLKLNSDFEIYKAFSQIPIESVIMYSTINSEIITHYFKNLQNIKLKITGKDLQNIGIKPSEKYQKCFDYILEKKLKNPECNLNDEISLAKKFFKII